MRMSPAKPASGTLERNSILSHSASQKTRGSSKRTAVFKRTQRSGSQTWETSTPSAGHAQSM